jgi:hypothetical protein
MATKNRTLDDIADDLIRLYEEVRALAAPLDPWRVFLCVKCGAAWNGPLCHSCQAEAVEVVENDDGTARCTRCGIVWNERDGSHMCAAPAPAASEPQP